MNFTDRERRALRYCTYCPRLCRFACPVAHGEARETVTPWGLMRLLNLVDQSIVGADVSVLETLHHCVSCERCTTVCLHDNPVADILRKGRQQLLAEGVEVPPMFRASSARCGTVSLPAVVGEALDVPVFVPSCAHRTSQADVDRFVGIAAKLHDLGLPLQVRSSDPTACPYHQWELGDTASAQSEWRSMTAAKLTVTDCAPSLGAFESENSLESGGVVHVADWLDAHLDELPEKNVAGRVVIHDSCTTTRRLGLADTIRRLVRHVTGQEPVDLFEAREQARCCGAQGYWAEAEPEAQARAAEAVAADIRDSDAQLVVTGSPACRRSLAEAVHGDTVEVVDLLGLVTR